MGQAAAESGEVLIRGPRGGGTPPGRRMTIDSDIGSDGCMHHETLGEEEEAGAKL